MSEDIDARVTPALHPKNIQTIDGYGDDTAPYLGQVETAFSEAYIGLGQVYDARAAAARNPTWNEAQQVIQTQDFAEKGFGRVARSMDSAKSNLDKTIAALEAQITAPVTARAVQGVSAEIRSFAKGLPSGKRNAFIQEAINSRDETTVTALLGAPCYLSGIDGNTQKVFTRLWHERNSPEIAKRVKALKGARDMIVNRGGLVFRGT